MKVNVQRKILFVSLRACVRSSRSVCSSRESWHIHSVIVYFISAGRLIASHFDYLRNYFQGTGPETGIFIFCGCQSLYLDQLRFCLQRLFYSASFWQAKSLASTYSQLYLVVPNCFCLITVVNCKCQHCKRMKYRFSQFQKSTLRVQRWTS